MRRTEQAWPEPGQPHHQGPVTAAQSKARRRTPQGDAELMAKNRRCDSQVGWDFRKGQVLLDGVNAEDTARALSAGARAILDRSASRNEIIAAIKAAIAGLVVVTANILMTL